MGRNQYQPKHQTMNGHAAMPTDPQRAVWYSAGGDCHYATDDWRALRYLGNGIPVCPECGALGKMTPFAEFAKHYPGFKLGVCRKEGRTIRSFLGG
ncbi:MAG: hypothetical protein ACRC7O_02255 [Fimbriiglobus sp.]